MIGGGRFLTWLSLRLRPMDLEIVHHHCWQPLQFCSSVAMPIELLDLGCFTLNKLELFTNEEACTLSHCLERLCNMKLVILSADDPRLLVENCVYLGEYYPVPGGR